MASARFGPAQHIGSPVDRALSQSGPWVLITRCCLGHASVLSRSRLGTGRPWVLVPVDRGASRFGAELGVTKDRSTVGLGTGRPWHKMSRNGSAGLGTTRQCHRSTLGLVTGRPWLGSRSARSGLLAGRPWPQRASDGLGRKARQLDRLCSTTR